jgi:hypothetical protein
MAVTSKVINGVASRRSTMTTDLIPVPTRGGAARKPRRSSRPKAAIGISPNPILLDDGCGDIHPGRREITEGDDSPQPTPTLPLRIVPSPDAVASHDRLQELGKEIDSQVHTLEWAACTGFDAKLKIGVCLIEAKKLCKRGEWTPFLEKRGLKSRTAEECMQFARHRDVLERNAHGRAHWTTEEARKVIALERKAAGQGEKTQSATGSPPDGAGKEDPGLDLGNPGDADGTAGSAAAGPSDSTSPAAAPEPAAEGQRGGESGDSAKPAEASGMSPEGSNPEGGQAQHRASDPNELSDAEWLPSIPLREKIQDKQHFDKEAIEWRRLQPELAPIRQRLAPSPEEVTDAAYLRPARDRLRVRILHGILIKRPHEWRLCSRCAGGGTERTGKLPCTRCDGSGFFVTHEGDVVDPDGPAD